MILRGNCGGKKSSVSRYRYVHQTAAKVASMTFALHEVVAP